MKRRQNKTGVTLVEILVVVAIIAILVAMVIGVAFRIDTQGKEQLTKNTLALLDAALGEFNDYGYNFKDPYSEFDFPLDCNDFPDTDLKNALEAAQGVTNVTSINGAHEPKYSGSEALYFFLSRVPESRKTLDKIDKSLITNKDENKQDMTITIDGEGYLLLRFIDPWGKTLRYSYYDNGKEGSTSEPAPPSPPRAFPLIISAGPDGDFNTVADNIRNR